MKSVSVYALMSLVAASCVLCVSVPTKAQSSECTLEPDSHVSPNTLASLAYQGKLEPEGIPAAGELTRQVKDKQISGSDIVNAAIEACLLSSDYDLHDNEAFVSEVEKALEPDANSDR